MPLPDAMSVTVSEMCMQQKSILYMEEKSQSFIEIKKKIPTVNIRKWQILLGHIYVSKTISIIKAKGEKNKI